MAIVLAFPYADWRISDALPSGTLTEANIATLVAASSADWTAATLAGDDVTVDTIAVATHQLNDNVMSFNPDESYAELDETTLADSAVRNRQGRHRWEATVRVLHDTAAGKSWPVMLADTSGVRLLYVDRHSGKKLAGLVSIFRVADQGQDAEGQAVSEVTLRNVASVAPVWTA